MHQCEFIQVNTIATYGVSFRFGNQVCIDMRTKQIKTLFRALALGDAFGRRLVPIVGFYPPDPLRQITLDPWQSVSFGHRERSEPQCSTISHDVHRHRSARSSYNNTATATATATFAAQQTHSNGTLAWSCSARWSCTSKSTDKSLTFACFRKEHGLGAQPCAQCYAIDMPGCLFEVMRFIFRCFVCCFLGSVCVTCVVCAVMRSA